MADISITAANVLRSPTGSQILTGIIAAATTITAGKAIVLMPTSNTIGLADSNGSGETKGISGIALSGGGAGQPVFYCPSDSAFTTGGTLTSGDVIYLSDTPGGMTNDYADIASGSTVITLGVVNTDGTMFLNPTKAGVK